jgi:capsular polysaccharide biosynthesis protein
VTCEHELSAELIVKRRPPANLQPQDLPLFVGELERRIPASRLLCISNVRITADGVLLKRGAILPETFPFVELRDAWKMRTRIKLLSQAYVWGRIRDIHEEALWVTDIWSTGYFHWLADVLSKVYVVHDLARHRVLLLPHWCEASDVVRRSLEAFGLSNVQFIGANDIVRCKTLLVPTPVAPSGHCRVDVIRAVRDEVMRRFAANASATPEGRVYISRERARRRRIVNEVEVIHVLRRHGCEVIHAEDLSFADQIRIASQARYLISNHGAGLTNMLFMRPGSSVLELRHRLDSINNCYFTLSSALDLRYWFQACDPIRALDDVHTADVVVNVAELDKNLSAMFNQ